MSKKQLVSFEIDDLLFGLNILLVKEINKKLDFTPVYDVAEFVVGTSNLRGQVITILDLGQRLNLKPREISSGSRAVVLKSENELSVHHKSGILTDHSTQDKVGIIVDSIGDVVEVDEKDIQALPANFTKVEAKFIDGVYQLDDKLMIILNLQNSLQLEEIIESN